MKDATDIPPEIDDHCKEGSEMEHDIKKELRFFQSEKGLEENEVTGATDRKELR